MATSFENLEGFAMALDNLIMPHCKVIELSLELISASRCGLNSREFG